MLEFDEPTHVYRLDGKVIPSVTQVIKSWSTSYGGVPRAVLDAKADLGQAVHLATEYNDEGTLDEDCVPEAVRPYLEAWRLFKLETGWETQQHEVMVHSVNYRYAGRLDAIGTMDKFRGLDEDTPVLLDKKTTYTLLPCVGPQVAAYMQAYNERCQLADRIKRRFAVQLKKNGKYQLAEYKSPIDWSQFQCALSMLAWARNNKMEFAE